MRARRTTGWAATALAALLGASLTAGPGLAAPEPATTGGAAAADRGGWQVAAIGGDRYRVSWTAPARLPVGSDRPRITGFEDAVVSVPVVAEDGRTVQVEVTAARRPDPAVLDVLLSGDRLDHTGDDRLQRSGDPVPPAAAALELPGTETLAVDPGAPGDYEVVTSDYDLDPIPLEGMRKPIEMVGHVVEPAADAETGPRPLVLFLHGRHSVCYVPEDPDAWPDGWPCKAPAAEIPSHLGYDYIQRVLASQGYATVSIRANGINAQDYALDDGGADARAELVEAHLRHWVGLAAQHQVDLDRVVLVGHSRGGEGVDRAAIQIPLDAPYRIAGQVLVAPTDFANQTAPYIPTVTVLPFCDGDVSDLQGQRFTDTARDIAADDTSLKSSVLVMGANHNYFNTEWTPGIAQDTSGSAGDDWWGNRKAECGSKHPERLDAAGQQAVGLAYIAGAVRLFADGEQEMLPLFDGSRARVASQADAQTLSHALGGGRDVRRPGMDAARSLAEGAETRTCRGELDASRMASCSFGLDAVSVAPHWPSSYEAVPVRKELEIAWTAPGQSGGLRLDEPLDLSTDRLELRASVDPTATDTSVQVRITDADGAEATLTPVGGGALPTLGATRQTWKVWAQTIVVDPTAAADEVDLTRIEQVDLVGQSARGRVWLLDLAAAPADLAAVSETRMPLIDVGSVRLDEGDERGLSIARLPFRIVGELTRPARIVVQTSGEEYRDEQRFTIDLAAGQTTGSIPVGYRANKRDDYDERVTSAAVWAVRHVMTDGYLGRLTIVDDDPEPKVKVTVDRKRITEGESARWRVRLSAKINYDYFVQARVVRGPKPVVRVGDIDPRWISRQVGSAKPGKALWKTRATVYDSIPIGRKGVTITIPTRRDQVAEPAKSLTLQFRVAGKRITRTVKVLDRRPGASSPVG